MAMLPPFEQRTLSPSQHFSVKPVTERRAKRMKQARVPQLCSCCALRRQQLMGGSRTPFRRRSSHPSRSSGFLAGPAGRTSTWGTRVPQGFSWRRIRRPGRAASSVRQASRAEVRARCPCVDRQCCRRWLPHPSSEPPRVRELVQRDTSCSIPQRRAWPGPVCVCTCAQA